MAKLRKAIAYRRIEMPYTRRSKYKQKAFVKTSPNMKIVRFDMGELNRRFPFVVNLITMDSLQLRHNSIESARMTGNRLLEENLGKTGYHMRVRMYPHHILRENPLATGAGADRMSTGMQLSFGKAIGVAAQVHRGKVIMEVRTTREHIALAKQALKRASYKMPCSCKITVQEVANAG